eukprot:2677663-Rhodomonas_salina.3
MGRLAPPGDCGEDTMGGPANCMEGGIASGGPPCGIIIGPPIATGEKGWPCVGDITTGCPNGGWN